MFLCSSTSFFSNFPLRSFPSQAASKASLEVLSAPLPLSLQSNYDFSPDPLLRQIAVFGLKPQPAAVSAVSPSSCSSPASSSSPGSVSSAQQQQQQQQERERKEVKATPLPSAPAANSAVSCTSTGQQQQPKPRPKGGFDRKVGYVTELRSTRHASHVKCCGVLRRRQRRGELTTS